jgi:hypothetical protein
VSLVMWICAVVPVVPALLFPTRAEVLLPALAGCVLAYHLFYRYVASSTRDSPAGEQSADARV